MSEVLWSEVVADDEATGWHLFRESIDPYVLARLSIPGEPASKSRARFTKQGSKTVAYTPEKTRVAEERIAWEFRKVRKGWTASSSATFGVFAAFYAKTFQRRDVDNMLKLVLDALNGIAWADDSQVSEVSGRVDRGSEDARTEIIIYWTWPNGRPPEISCEACGKRVRVYPSGSDQRYCSKECSYGSRTRNARTCERCDATFIPVTGTKDKAYCSDTCRSEGHRVRLSCVHCSSVFEQWTSWATTAVALCSKPCQVAYWKSRGVKSAKGTCETCGGATSRREYKRCRGCVAQASQGRSRGPQSNQAATDV
jgi:Holliday junction resolvase RusA-like endonuclease